MRTVILIAWVVLTTLPILQAQTPDIIRIKGGGGGEKAVPASSRYRYDQFLDGSILYRNGSVAEARLNYNVLLDEIQFIDPKGDTLSLASEPVVRIVSVGPTVFWYDLTKGYLEIIADYTAIKLALKHGLRMAQNEKLAGYGQSSGTSAIVNYQSYSSGTTTIRNFDAKGDLMLIKSRTYFIIDQNNRVQLLNKPTLTKVFGKYRDQIGAYLNNNAVDFNQEEDLKKLLTYCRGLL